MANWGDNSFVGEEEKENGIKFAHAKREMELEREKKQIDKRGKGRDFLNVSLLLLIKNGFKSCWRLPIVSERQTQTQKTKLTEREPTGKKTSRVLWVFNFSFNIYLWKTEEFDSGEWGSLTPFFPQLKKKTNNTKKAKILCKKQTSCGDKFRNSNKKHSISSF